MTIRPALQADANAVKQLWQFYQYHQSSFDQADIDNQGRFDIDDDYLEGLLATKASTDKRLPLPKEEDDCIIYLIEVGECIAGFVALEISEVADRLMPELADIFILPKYRHQGLASHTIAQLITTKSDIIPEWHLAIYEQDLQAKAFWQRWFASHAQGRVTQLNPPEVEGFLEFVVMNA